MPFSISSFLRESLLIPRHTAFPHCPVLHATTNQLDDLVSSYGFPKTIAPDRTPTLSAAMAGAGGILPSCLRELVATSNRALLTQFPDKVAAAISAGR